MATKQSPAESVTKQAGAQAKLDAALAQLKTATDRQELVTSALSRLGASAEEKRFAQAEQKKVEHALREARRLVKEAQGL
ncbi:MAG: hypothetical protein JWP65_3385 [Ramlibacter sp.]|jgi:hypothetical protein|uniref:hypothetical protein n=1 Tax=Ramlibacter sp. TaxID=1917967 RepID=UPI0026371CF1|nr:hypothetical protein [Ramlibacter sp.]MDB5752964.1 hypothetical protein [Ramlibacter sp.]